MSIKNEEKIKRRITFQLFKNKVGTEFHKRSIYKINRVSGEENNDPYRECKTLADVRQVLLTVDKDTLASLFSEGFDFILVKIDKRNLTSQQQFFPDDIS